MSWRIALLFSTSTLELGVDIGDIDLVVLDGPAPDIASLLQRIGRGNRRTDKTRVMSCAATLAEVLVQSAMIESARHGDMGAQERGSNHAVARQQLAKYEILSSQRGLRRTQRADQSPKHP